MSLPPPRPDATCLVTGASSGIGTEIARCLARRGHGVVLVARSEERLRVLAGELAQEHGVRAEVVTADLADATSRLRLLDEVGSLGLDVEVLVNNAGLGTAGPVADADVEAELRMVRTNVEAVVHLCTALVPAMAAAGRGAVLNVASTAAYQPLPGQAGYAATKAFVLSYSHSLQGELAGRGVTVTALCPGPVDTGFFDAAGISGDERKALPSAFWVPAEQVASAGVEGVARGRAVVIPGAVNAVSATLAQLTPRRLLVPLLARRHPALRR